MKKVLLTLLLALVTWVAQGQTDPTASEATTNKLNTQWSKFTQLAEKKQYKQAIEEGIRTSLFFTENRQYKEAFATCRQMDALIYSHEQEAQHPDYALRYQVTKERLRMYTRLKNAEQCKRQLDLLHTYADQMKSDSVAEDLLLAEAGFYRTFGMPDKSLACYKELFRKRSAGKDKRGIDLCYKEMLSHAEQSNDAPLAIAMRKLYTSWQDSIKAVKASQELSALQQKYDAAQQGLQEKENRIASNLYIIIALCVLCAALGGGVLFLAALLFKHLREAKKLKQSLAIANDNNEQKSHFISNISTQIEPTLNRMDETATKVSSAKMLHENIQALKKLMADIQTYITLEESREEYYPLKELNVNTLCESIMEKAKVQFNPDVEAVVNVPRINIKTNAEALERILLYLLGNAAFYTKSGKITLEFKKRSAHTGQFMITDTGAGIPAETRANLFKPFAEIHDLTKGNGLGLPTCRLIAYKLSGTLHLDTEYKKGTRFILELHS